MHTACVQPQIRSNLRIAPSTARTQACSERSARACFALRCAALLLSPRRTAACGLARGPCVWRRRRSAYRGASRRSFAQSRSLCGDDMRAHADARACLRLVQRGYRGCRGRGRTHASARALLLGVDDASRRARRGCKSPRFAPARALALLPHRRARTILSAAAVRRCALARTRSTCLARRVRTGDAE